MLRAYEHAALPRLRSVSRGTALLALLSLAACGSAPGEDLFGGGALGGGGAGGEWGSGATSSTSATTGAATTSSSGSTTASSTTTATTGATTTSGSTTTSTSTGPSPVCGDGVCDPSETGFCPQDCSTCAHPICASGDKLDPACDACAANVCQSDAFCCDNAWDATCVHEADQLCNAGCCGDGQCNESCTDCPQDCGACQCGDGKCDGETCSTCPQDCGSCQPTATCPHSVCDPGAALGANACPDACVDHVCEQKPECCAQQQSPTWNADCSNLALQLCGPDTCIESVCQSMPSCCSVQWTQACVDAAKAKCATPCSCAHSLCVENAGKLDAGCSPCTAALCQADPYCCDSSWDGICVQEVGTICEITCN